TRWPRDWSSDVCSSDLASADEFARELREAMSSASAELKRTGDSAPIDPGKTIVTPAPANVTSPPTGSSTAFDPLAGTISAAALQIGRASCRERRWIWGV